MGEEMVMADEISEYTFTLKEGNAAPGVDPEQPLWIVCEPRTRELSIVGAGFLSLRLKAGTPLATAREIVKELQSHVDGIGCTP
jgi:hypothetical protein